MLGYLAAGTAPLAGNTIVLWFTATAAAAHIMSVPLLWFVVADVSRRQAHARASRHGPRALPAGEQTAGSAQTVLVSYAAEDRAAAEVLCEALETRGIDCWLARRDASWDARAIHAFGTVVVLLSAHLEGSAATLAELELAIEDGTAILPFRLDQTVVPAAFRYLLGSIHWFDYQGSSFDQQKETVLQVIRRQRRVAALATADAVAEDYRLGQGTEAHTTRRRTHRVFYVAAGVYVTVALLAAAVVVIRSLRQTVPADDAIGWFVTITVWRVALGFACLAGFYLWQRTANGVIARRGRWRTRSRRQPWAGSGRPFAVLRGSSTVALIDGAMSVGVIAPIQW
jgi:hypothetical protein